jgi:hypothetical protein
MNNDIKEFPAVLQAEYSKRIEFKGAVYYVFESFLNNFSDTLDLCECSIDIFLSELDVIGCKTFLFLLEKGSDEISYIIGSCFDYRASKMRFEYWKLIEKKLCELESEVVA